MIIMLKKYSSSLHVAASFIVPILIIALILAMKGIWWGSQTTILASDAFHQYVIFNQVLRNILHGDGSLFYTFTSGLGLNFYALSSYYLGSILSPFVYFFDLKSMPDALYLFTLLKFGLTGLSTYLSLSTIYQKLQPVLVLVLSTCFSLMSFSTSQLEINIWLDTFILVPLILLGLHRIIEKKGSLLYFVSLTVLFIQNYYFGYMMALFLAVWFPVQLSWEFKKRIGSVIDFVIVSLLAALTSMIMLVPSYLDLKTHGETLTKIVNLQTENSWYLDLFAKNVIGSYDTTKFGAIPMIYVGIFPLILALVFFTIKSIKWQVKVSYGLLLVLIITSFYLQPLDLLWQGMHAPNMFLHRYAWIFSLVIIYMAAEVLTRLSSTHFREYLIPLLLLMAGFGVTFFFRERYKFLTTIHFLLSLEFLIAYGILLFAISTKRITLRIFSGFSLLFVLFELGLNTNYQVDGLSTEWHFPSRDSYEQNLTDIDNLVTYTKATNSEFYRTERLFPQTGNDSMKYNYNGISQFSSIRNRASSSTLDKLGFRSDGTNLNLRYQNNTIIADSLFAIQYNLVAGTLAKFGFSPIHSSGQYSLYENSYSLPLAILTNSVYKDVNFSHLTLDNQSHFLNQLAGLDFQYYYRLEPSNFEGGAELNNRVIVSKTGTDDTPRIQYSVLVPAHTQLYVNIPNISFTSDSSKNVQFTINNVTKNFTLDNTFSLFDAGYFETEQIVTLTMSFPHNAQVSFDNPQFYRLDTTAYQAAMDKIKSQKVQVKTKGHNIFIEYTSDTDASLLLTLPYDKGWSASQNGRNLAIQKAQKGFMKIDVTKGSGTITLSFIPQGFVIGLGCFITGILLFILYNRIRIKKNNHKSYP